MNARIPDAHRVDPTHDQAPPSSQHDAEDAVPPGAKPYTAPVLEELGTVSEVTAGSNIFGD